MKYFQADQKVLENKLEKCVPSSDAGPSYCYLKVINSNSADRNHFVLQDQVYLRRPWPSQSTGEI